MLNSELVKKAHKMAREIKAQYPEVDYRFQLGLCLSYLLNNKEEIEMTRIQELIKKFKLEVAKKDGVKGLKFGKRPTEEEMENEVVEIRSLKEEIMTEINRQWYEECEKEEIEDKKRIKLSLEADDRRMEKGNFRSKSLKKSAAIKNVEIIELTDNRTWNSETCNVYCYGECIGTMTRVEALKNGK